LNFIRAPRPYILKQQEKANLKVAQYSAGILPVPHPTCRRIALSFFRALAEDKAVGGGLSGFLEHKRGWLEPFFRPGTYIKGGTSFWAVCYEYSQSRPADNEPLKLSFSWNKGHMEARVTVDACYR
jgi:hypothetical protein